MDKFDNRLTQTTILVVDPDDTALADISMLLETRKLYVRTASSLAQAIKIVTREAIDLIIADETLRADTGLSLAELARAVPGAADIPFLFTTQTQTPGVISRPMENRNAFFIRKPFDHKAFLDLVEYAMWMPHLIRSHIVRIHQQQGLAHPRIATKTVDHGGSRPFSIPVTVIPATETSTSASGQNS